MSEPTVVVVCGGTSAEREVSLGSGRAIAAGLVPAFQVELLELDRNELPGHLDPARHVAFLALHGTFGEDGAVQHLLEERGIAYTGCDPQASALCMDKTATKERVAPAGVRVAPGLRLTVPPIPVAAELTGRLGSELVLKPNAEGSSVGLRVVGSAEELDAALSGLTRGEWLVEQKIGGRELTVGLLEGRAMGVVEIAPKSGRFDYASKYTKGQSEYFAPARISESVAAEVRRAAEAAFAACDCRDYARIDFILSPDGDIYFLEINTLPGMKETSLLPMSARCSGYDFSGLLSKMIAPALERFRRRSSVASS